MARPKKQKVQKRRQEKKHKKSLRRKEARRASKPYQLDPFLEAGFGSSSAMLPKLSETIIAYAEPMLNEAQDINQEEKALEMAVTFWNLSFDSEQNALQLLKDHLKNLFSDDVELRQEFLDIFHMMYHRKHEHFSRDRRFILSDSIDKTPDGLYLQVSSTVI